MYKANMGLKMGFGLGVQMVTSLYINYIYTVYCESTNSALKAMVPVCY